MSFERRFRAAFPALYERLQDAGAGAAVAGSSIFATMCTGGTEQQHTAICSSVNQQRC